MPAEYENKSWNHAARRVMSPPFRAKVHQDSLWAGLQSGSLQVVATDHCAFTTEQKRLGFGDFRKIPNGTGGLEDRLPLLWTAGVNTGRLTKEEFVAVTSSNIARILNIYPRKGRLSAGSDADIVVWDPAASKTITAKSQLSRIDYNVFEGFACTGAPVVTLSRGKIAFKEGELRAEKGDGHYIERPPFPPVHVANSTWKLQNAPQAVRAPGGRRRPSLDLGSSDLKPFLADGGVGLEVGRRAFEHDAAVAHDVEAAGNLQRDGEFLLDQQDRDAAPGDFVEQAAHLLDQLGGEAFGRLVDHDQVGIAHQRAAHGEHLLLAARQHAGGDCPGARRGWETARNMSSKFQRPNLPARFSPSSRFCRTVSAGKDLPVLRHVADAGMGDLVGPQAGDGAALEDDPAERRHQAHDRLAAVERPTPLRPSRLTISPSSIAKSTPCRMWLLP